MIKALFWEINFSELAAIFFPFDFGVVVCVCVCAISSSGVEKRQQVYQTVVAFDSAARVFSQPVMFQLQPVVVDFSARSRKDARAKEGTKGGKQRPLYSWRHTL
jgi:hypothetical protein